VIESLRILHRRYRVQEWTEAEFVTTDSYGQCDKQRGIIYICTHLDPIVVADTFLHEILHAIWNEYNLAESDQEERIVHTLATGLIQVFFDNPELITWLRKMTKEN
jgi:Zn-dependent peptidase ImmA (M78 family)